MTTTQALRSVIKSWLEKAEKCEKKESFKLAPCALCFRNTVCQDCPGRLFYGCFEGLVVEAVRLSCDHKWKRATIACWNVVASAEILLMIAPWERTR